MQADLITRLGQAAVAAHDGVHAGQQWWERWNFDPEILIPVALMTALYLRGLYVWRERSRPHPRWRTACYLLGVALLVATIETPIDALAEHHFFMHMIQHDLLMMYAAPLILLGAPTTPMLRGMPRWLRLGVVRRLARRSTVRRAYRLLTHPLAAVGLLTVMLWAWHLAPGWYDAALRQQLVHDLQHLSYMLLGVLFWWNVIDPAPLRARMAYPLRMVYLLVAGTPKHLLAALITFASAPLYGAYAEVEPIVALGLLDDQVTGGLIMWVPSQMMHLSAIAVVFFVWANKSEREEREREPLAASATPNAGAVRSEPAERRTG